MNLQLKHLAPYLPYGLKMKVFDTFYNYDTMTLCDKSGFSNIGLSEVIDEPEDFKPILTPLSELPYYSNGIKHLGYRTDANNFLNLISDIENNKGNYDLMQMCFEEHIDVFGLIKAGLAVDKNKLT